MRSRDVTIPLGLWICAALCAHFLFGTGGLVVGTMHDDRGELWSLARRASELASQSDVEFDVSMAESNDTAQPKALEPVPPPPAVPPSRVTPPPPEARRPPDEKPVPSEPKAKPAPPVDTKPLVVIPKPKEPSAPAPEPPTDHRIAVQQHVRPNQDDNPSARFLGNEANHVDNETAATQTSHDRDDEHPTPGGNHPGADSRPGDSERTRIAESEDRPGEKNKAPGERVPELEVVREPRIPAPIPATAPGAHAADRTPGSHERAAASEATALPQNLAGTQSPEVASGAAGTWSFNPTQPLASASASENPGAGPATPSLPGGKLWSLPGLGKRPARGELNTNVDSSQVAAIVGSDALARMRDSDGERRRSEHRGSWTASSFERWRSAIENYVSSVKPGNQTALNTARSPFATYLNAIHLRIHPIFADSFLGSLEQLPRNHPLNDPHLMTLLEIVLAPDGRLIRMGIVKTSGVTSFDIAALDAVDRAQPFGPAPQEIISGDGRVYFHWEFHRDEVFACSTAGARPYLLPAASPSDPSPGPGTAPRHQPVPNLEPGVAPGGANDLRHGMTQRLRRHRAAYRDPVRSPRRARGVSSFLVNP